MNGAGPRHAPTPVAPAKAKAPVAPPPPPLGDTARVVSWELVFYGGAQLTAMLLERSLLGSVAVQAAIAEWGAGRVSVTWSDASAAPPSWQAMARRAGGGAAFGFAGGALAVAFVLWTRAATLATTAPLVTQLALGLLLAALTAVRDELMLRGFVLRALAGWPSWYAGLAACGLASAAAKLGVEGATPIEIASAALAGVALGAVWQRDRGAWMAVGANTAWIFVTSALIRGGALDVRFLQTSWGGVSVTTGLAGLVAMGALAAAAVVWSRRPRA